ncbi:MAG TPA: transcription-repair coupling factor, partial [Woeseiaceae bacterium]
MTESVLFKTRPKLPDARNQRVGWGRLLGAANAFALADLARQEDRLILCLARDPRHADQLEAEVAYFAGDDVAVLHFVDWETLPYDSFSPHQDIVSQRLETLAQLPGLRKGVVIVSAPTLLNRLPPVDYVALQSIRLRTGQELPRDEFIRALGAAGYLRVPQVPEHGEYAVRGSLL